ncbi:DUF1476 domain-containing protein [Falsirhodobacter deserti]|uniref:DUF1476 domain-containing protein n=1 Tax=Falsirhodobacter deserti TaxID=1365611 RepID=UPI000FE370C7|nr:DUF1476 domain-containing protein [Falsirhodobacter deserti]
MTNLNDRARAFETQYARDADKQFRAEARRNRLLGAWAADVQGMTGAEAEEYAASVVRADFQEAGHEDVVRKLVEDLRGHASEPEIRAKLAEYEIEAKAQLADQNSES